MFAFTFLNTYLIPYLSFAFLRMSPSLMAIILLTMTAVSAWDLRRILCGQPRPIGDTPADCLGYLPRHESTPPSGPTSTTPPPSLSSSGGPGIIVVVHQNSTLWKAILSALGGLFTSYGLIILGLKIFKGYSWRQAVVMGCTKGSCTSFVTININSHPEIPLGEPQSPA